MSTTNQPVRACVLKVDVKCCSGCQKKACRKLQNLPGVTAAEYNARKGLMTVTGDVEPMTLVQKLTNKRKTELVSVNYMPDDNLISSDEDEDDDEDDTSSSDDDTSTNPYPRTMNREAQVSMKPTMKNKEGMVRKYLLLGCLRSKPKVVQPFPLAKRMQMFGSTRFGNGGSDPLGNGGAFPRRPPPPQFHGPPMNSQQQFHMMMQQRQPQQHPQFQMNVAPPMHVIQQSGPPQKLPYFMQQEPQYKEAIASMLPPPQPKPDPKMLVNHAIHYAGK